MILAGEAPLEIGKSKETQIVLGVPGYSHCLTIRVVPSFESSCFIENQNEMYGHPVLTSARLPFLEHTSSQTGSTLILSKQ